MAKLITIAEEDIRIEDEDAIIIVTDNKGKNYRIYAGNEGLMISTITGKINIELYSGQQIHIK